MKKTKFTGQRIAFALRQAETGIRVAEVCRKLGISDATFYNCWKKGTDFKSVPKRVWSVPELSPRISRK